MIKKILFTTVAFGFALSPVIYADNSVACSAYLTETKYAHVINLTSHQTFFVKRHFHHGISNESYIFPNGKVIHGQSRVMKGKITCAAFAKHWGHYQQYSTYIIYKKPIGYFVKVIYANKQKQKMLVYPLTKQQIKNIRIR